MSPIVNEPTEIEKSKRIKISPIKIVFIRNSCLCK